jgi:UDP-N-acetyl-2-amino-2-deoxyglucuronate dehydrogenase
VRTVPFAIVGCGAIARKHVASIAACPEARLAAVCDLNAERMKQMAELWHKESGEHGELAQIADFQKVIANPAIPIIVIATVSGLHAEIAKEALRAGKHIVLEKPIALSLRDVDDMIQLAADRKLYVQVCHQLRYRPLMRKIKDLLLSGKLGEILTGSVTLRIHRSPAYYQSVSWRGSWEHDGGMLLNQGIHAIDLLLWFLGMPKKIYGEISSLHPIKETEDLAFGVMTFPNGAKGMIEANSMTLPENLEQSIFLLGDKGAICIGGAKMDRINRWYIEGQPNAADEAHLLLNDNDEHVYMYQALVEAYLGKKYTDMIDLSEGRRALELIFAIYMSASSAKVQSLPITDFSTIQMKLR